MAETNAEAVSAETDLPTNIPGEDSGVFRALSSVVKIRVAAVFEDPINAKDLQRYGDDSITNGIAIDTKFGPRLLSNAHGLPFVDEAFLQVQRGESDEMFVATVFARCMGSDLGLLEVKDQKFWKDLELVPIADTPSLRSEVLMAGFLDDGNELSVTKGVVSRIESHVYVTSAEMLPAITVDASTQHSGRSAAVFNTDGELVGIRFQILASAENVSLAVPPPVLKHFLSGIAKFGVKGYKGTPSPGLQVQELTNPYLRDHLKLNPEVCGVLVTECRYGHGLHGIVRERDVITHIGDTPVSNNGTVPFEKHSRIHLIAAFGLYQCGEKIDLRIVRDGKPLTVQVEARPCACLVKMVGEIGETCYIQWAGLVFRKLTVEYIQVSAESSPYLWHLAFWGQQTKDQDCAIVLSQVMSDTVNTGYESFVNQQIVSVNGHPIKNVMDLEHRINSSLTKLVRFETREGNVMAVPSPLDASSSEMMKRIDQKYAGAYQKYAPSQVNAAQAACATCCPIF